MTKAVTSLSNATVKAVRALHMRKAREETKLFLAEGLKVITEGVELGHAPKTLLFGPGSDHPLLKKPIDATQAAGGEVFGHFHSVAWSLGCSHEAIGVRLAIT